MTHAQAYWYAASAGSYAPVAPRTRCRWHPDRIAHTDSEHDCCAECEVEAAWENEDAQEIARWTAKMEEWL